MTALDRCNPTTRLLAAAVVTTPLLVTLDWLSATVAVVLDVAALLLAGVGARTLLRRVWPMLVLAPLSGVSMLLYATPGGREYLSWGLLHVSDASIRLAVATSIRVLALSVPVLGLLLGLDPTDVADGLAQVVRLPARLVLGSLAGMRMLTLLRDDWRTLGQARRARGLGDSGALRRFVTMSFAILVLALRRGGRLATAMEARGFGAGPRTWARPSRVGRPDAVLLLVAVGIVAVALAVAVAAGTFHTLWFR